MNVNKEMRRTSAWVSRRVRPGRIPRDDGPSIDYEFQVPSHWLDNLALWAKTMLVVIALSTLAGYVSMVIWVFTNG